MLMSARKCFRQMREQKQRSWWTKNKWTWCFKNHPKASMAETQHTRKVVSAQRGGQEPGPRSCRALQAMVKTRFYYLSVKGNHWRFSDTLCFPSPKTPQEVAWPKLMFFKRLLWLIWGEQTLWSKRKSKETSWGLLHRFRREMKIVWTRVVKVQVERHGGIQNTFWKLSWQVAERLGMRCERRKSQGRYQDVGPEKLGNRCGGVGNQESV